MDWSTTDLMAAEEVVTWTTTEALVDLDEVDSGGSPYLTFMEGWRFRFDHWRVRPWYGGQWTSLVPVADGPRRFEEAGRSRRWTSGFK